MPRNRGKNTTLLASLSVEGIRASMLLEGATTAAAFEIYLEQILLPSLAAFSSSWSWTTSARTKERGCANSSRSMAVSSCFFPRLLAY